jgi:hypothetical protein
MPDSGFLVIGDLSGFTAYLTDTELEHGPAMTAQLLEAVIQYLSPHVEIEGVAGDSVFAIAPDRGVGRPLFVLDLLEGAFVAFRERQRELQLGNSCGCSACAGVGNLNLKLIAHHGSYLRQQVSGRRQVAGTDVIVAHRLLKNSLGRNEGYLLLTEAAVRQVGIEPAAAGLERHEERYEHLGRVACWVKNLEPVWQQTLATREVRVRPEEAVGRLSLYIPAQPAVVFDWALSPDKRLLYENVDEIEEVPGQGGRMGAGCVMHCRYGRRTVDLHIRDLKPYRYFTLDMTVMGIGVRITGELESEAGGTRYVLLAAPVPGTPLLKRVLLRVLVGSLMRQMGAGLRRMADLIRLSQQAEALLAEAN